MEVFVEENILSVVFSLLILPFISYLMLRSFGRILPRQGDWLSMGITTCMLALSLLLFVFNLQHSNWSFHYTVPLLWINLGDIQIDYCLFLDIRTVLMLVVLHFISAIVQFVSVKSLFGHRNYAKYFAYLSLLTFGVTGVLLSDNLIVMYLFWELIGLSSFYLIGFLSEEDSLSSAALVTFVVDRLGGLAVLVGIMILFIHSGVTHVWEVNQHFGAIHIESFWITITGFCFLCGVMSRSALFPLHVWLPEALKKSTPAGALIVSSANVAAGIYFAVRMLPLLAVSISTVVLYVGALTTMLASAVAVCQTDIKKILAYTAISQTGFMMIGLGLGAEKPVFLFLVVYSFMISGLYLSMDGISGVLQTADIREMGGLRKKMPFAFALSLFFALAVCGIPGTAGYLGKSSIFAQLVFFALENKVHFILVFISLCGIGLTALFLFRMIFIIFFGSGREKEKPDRIQGVSPFVNVLLAVLALLTVYVWYTLPHINPLSTEGGWLDKLIAGQISFSPSYQEKFDLLDGYGALQLYILIISIIFIIACIYITYLFYVRKRFDTDSFIQKFPQVHRIFVNELYLLKTYDQIAAKGILWCGRMLNWFEDTFFESAAPGLGLFFKRCARCFNVVEYVVVHSIVEGISYIVLSSGKALRYIHSGRLQDYLTAMLLGVILIIVFLLLR